MDGKDLPWYSCYLSDLDHRDLSVLQSLLQLDSSYELRLPSPNEHPSSPPEGCITVFRDQIMGGLRFPLHPFISDLCQYCGIGVSQFAPNVFRAICGTVILCPADKLTGVLVRLSVLMLEGILYTFGLSPVPAEIGAPFAAAILRSFACQETPAVAVLEALHQELTPGLPSDPAAAFDPQLPVPPTSDVVIAPPLAVLPSPSAADPALSHTSDQPATASSPTRQAPPLRPTLRLRVTRNSKRTAPVTATSPPPSQRQRVVVLSSPSKSSGTSSAQETSLGQEQAYDLEVAGPPSDRLTTAPLQSVLPALPSPSGGQPLDSLTPPASSPLIPTSSAVPISEPPSPDWAFRALWRLPSATDPANVPAATSSPFFGRIDFHGALANSWQSAHRQFWESEYPLEELDQVACSLVATCSASLSVVQRATELERENVALKARLRELEPPSSSTAPSEPSLKGLDSSLHAAGESAASARALSDAAFNKLRALEAALKATQTVANAAVGRETTLRAQWEACQAQLQSLQAELSRAQEAVSQGQSDLAAARAEATQDKDAMAEYLAGELGRLKAYRLAYVRSSFFLQKLGRWMVVLLSYGAAGGVRQAFEQGYLRAAPPATFLDTARLARELPQDTFPSFEADDGLFFQAAPPPAAASTPVEVSPQDLPATIPEASEALAPPPAEPADPASPRSAPDNLSPPSPNVV
ncbi:uncharacterized protein LOC122014052 [Zingiber officinale]|uniref:uncharacterized protein LOC122014052 n=1 Tax=Zingiber officinale TaxID=94328 RepID=UPI001C4DCD36|nr:uncharacterized protein LOC122014052 [Zingiber officinale]